ncbi:hypothetical protein BDN67DRAFT_1064535 [Paxillus ammoniavirescens]|nr:hypothetical protein BDN67DRAFT_1064535 [Paxillus ammoniavirescens]
MAASGASSQRSSMDDITTCLVRAEHEILTAFSGGTDTLETYQAAWSSLLDDVTLASASGKVDSDTWVLAHTVASNVATIADCLLTVNHKQQELTDLLHNDLQCLLGNLSVADSTPPQPPVSRTLPPQEESSPSGAHPTFIATAYSWLLSNLHNPYPSMEAKTEISRSTGCSMLSLNSWFANARRRMGWTELCRDRFRNCKADAADAAYRALVKEDPQRPLDPELIHAFMVMKVTAEGLYSSMFIKSALAGDLDVVVKDMTEEDRKRIEDARHWEAEETKLVKQHEKESRRRQRSAMKESQESIAQHSYPSPDRSRATSPVPPLDDSLTEESEEEVSPPVMAGRKRRSSSSSEPADRTSFVLATRPTKRLRSSTSGSFFTSDVCLPSPPSSTDDCSDNDSPTSVTHIPSQYPTNARKRRLSDADANSVPKRPRGSTAGPRLHAVSDPLPRSHLESEYSIDEWFNTNFDGLFALPPPVDAAEPDFSAPWEVELFNDYSIPQDLQKRAPKSPPRTQDSRSSASADLAVLESLLQSIESGKFVAPSETANLTPPSFIASLPDSASYDVGSSSDLSQSIDWTTLLNSPKTFEPAIDANQIVFPQQLCADSQPLPEIDLSILQLPLVMPTAMSQFTLSGDLASKQSKLTQLQAMQEAVQRMQKELQSEGVVL